MRDRAALDAFLTEAGFARAGDAVLLEPTSSETKEVRRSERSVVATISTRARDRHGDVINPAGVRLDRFRKNPVVLYAHDYAGLPVAKSLWERVRAAPSAQRGGPDLRAAPSAQRGGPDLRAAPSAQRGGPDLRAVAQSDGDQIELVAKPQFHLNTELSREVWALVEKGVLSAWSVGFIPEEWEPGPEGKGFSVTKWDLLEYSCVPVPANFQALTHELKSRRITAPALVKSLAPLGFEAPDLVEHEVTAAFNKDAQDTQDGRQQERGRGRHHPVDPVHSCRDVVSVEAAVSRAFERVIARARGQGHV